MNSFEQVSNTFEESLRSVWGGIVEFLPSLILAILIVIIGWIIGAAVSKVIEQIIKAIKVDSVLASAGVDNLVERSGFKLNSGRFLGEIVKWFVIVVALIAAFDVLNLDQINEFLGNVVTGFLPQVISAVLILLIAVVIAEAMKNLVIGSAKTAKIKAAHFLGAVAKWSILIFALLIALDQLNQLDIGQTIISILLQGVATALAIGLGLAFGLGGQDAARDFIQKLKDEIKNRE